MDLTDAIIQTDLEKRANAIHQRLIPNYRSILETKLFII